MSSWLETYKPVASSRFQLWLAGAMWSGVGIGLIAVGTYWLSKNGDTWRLIMVLVAVGLGLGKAVLALNRTADSIVTRIRLRGDDRCVGGFLSPRVWALVVGMMLLGRFLRSTAISGPVLGILYTAVGIGLLASSWRIWKAWRRHGWSADSEGEHGG